MPPTAPDPSPYPRAGTAWAVAPLLLFLVAASGCQDNESAIARGDRLWADSSYTNALAEYRLAASQRGDEEALSRLAHAAARTGELLEAREVYDGLAGREDRYRDQAVYDLLDLMDQGLRRDDGFTAATALGAALELNPGLALPGPTWEVARFYQQRGQVEDALHYYRRAMAALPPDSAVELLYEIGRLEEERGRCARAMDYYGAFRDQAGTDRQWVSLVGEARWRTGSCAFRLAVEARDSGRSDEALARLDAVIRLGVPENLLDQAWFDRGELLLDRGDDQEALASFRRVLERNPSRAGRLVERAQERIDEIRFGDPRLEGIPRGFTEPPDPGEASRPTGG